MSLADWYHHKADQCAQLANDATAPRKCASYQHEQKLWLQMAEQIEKGEKNRPDL